MNSYSSSVLQLLCLWAAVRGCGWLVEADGIILVNRFLLIWLKSGKVKPDTKALNADESDAFLRYCGSGTKALSFSSSDVVSNSPVISQSKCLPWNFIRSDDDTSDAIELVSENSRFILETSDRRSSSSRPSSNEGRESALGNSSGENKREEGKRSNHYKERFELIRKYIPLSMDKKSLLTSFNWNTEAYASSNFPSESSGTYSSSSST